MRRDILHLKRVAQIRLVGSVFRHRFIIRNARERRRRHHALRSSPVGEFLEHAVQNGFDRREHVVLGDEAHLEIKLIEFAWAAIGARILIAEARRDLEIPVETGDHQ